MKIIYTESAMEELERFQKQRKDELELFLKNKKYIFGDDIVEITASDIREADKFFKVVEFSKTKLPLTNMLLKAYLIGGFAMVILGLFYPTIMQMLDRNPTQLALVIGGLTLSLVSFFGSYYLRFREERHIELENRYKNFESKLSTEDKDK
ncbi:hypothetical protein [Acinetobacter beijerinckii]|uniref:Uncharacterized protein n=1 Tax=Acinetobacter beijerinckii CIP 110307 TaxID=1217648 RepID=N9E996_9GAMM|nr:hypothetical protein [Acinetobacter beijerinckii]ENW06797.1 hypothetical protein F933_01248 [Acinetobacter beijerinckii CIP 110307]